MTRPEAEAAAREIVDAIYDDIRDRHFIKWMFSEHATTIDSVENGWLKIQLKSIDRATQKEIKLSWTKIVADHLFKPEIRGEERVERGSR